MVAASVALAVIASPWAGLALAAGMATACGVSVLIARALFDSRRYQEAADAFTELVERSPAEDYAHYGLGMSLYIKRLEAGKFIWPVSQNGTAVAISAAQLGYLLEGIDWRNPRWTQRPRTAG